MCRGLSRKGKALVMKPYEEQKEQAMNWAFAMTLRQRKSIEREKYGFIDTIQPTAS